MIGFNFPLLGCWGRGWHCVHSEKSISSSSKNRQVVANCPYVTNHWPIVCLKPRPWFWMRISGWWFVVKPVRGQDLIDVFLWGHRWLCLVEGKKMMGHFQVTSYRNIKCKKRLYNAKWPQWKPTYLSHTHSEPQSLFRWLCPHTRDVLDITRAVAIVLWRLKDPQSRSRRSDFLHVCSSQPPHPHSHSHSLTTLITSSQLCLSYNINLISHQSVPFWSAPVHHGQQ